MSKRGGGSVSFLFLSFLSGLLFWPQISFAADCKPGMSLDRNDPVGTVFASPSASEMIIVTRLNPVHAPYSLISLCVSLEAPELVETFNYNVVGYTDLAQPPILDIPVAPAVNVGPTPDFFAADISSAGLVLQSQSSVYLGIRFNPSESPGVSVSTETKESLSGPVTFAQSSEDGGQWLSPEDLEGHRRIAMIRADGLFDSCEGPMVTDDGVPHKMDVESQFTEYGTRFTVPEPGFLVTDVCVNFGLENSGISCQYRLRANNNGMPGARIRTIGNGSFTIGEDFRFYHKPVLTTQKLPCGDYFITVEPSHGFLNLSASVSADSTPTASPVSFMKAVGESTWAPVPAEGGYEQFIIRVTGTTAGGDGLPCDVPLHSADSNRDSTISLSELLGVITFYNAGALRCTDDDDGFGPGTGDTECPRHSSDYQDAPWVISLSELLRLVQLYSAGDYHACPFSGTEDGFCSGAASG